MQLRRKPPPDQLTAAPVLLGDCFYLPFDDGPAAAALLGSARRLLASDPARWGDAAGAFRQQAGRLRDVCARVAELRDRRLFHALSRRVWELREEMDLLQTYVRCKEEDAGAPCQSDFHLPGYRGSMVARLQQLLRQQPDGTFIPGAGAGTEDDRPGTATETAP